MAKTRLNQKQLDTLGRGNLATDNELDDAIVEHEGKAHPHTQYAKALELTKYSVGLTNVDNTSDANKPVSTLQAAALAMKINWSLIGAPNGVASLDANGKILNLVLNNDLFAISNLTGQTGVLKRDGDGLWSVDNSDYYNSLSGIPWSAIIDKPIIETNYIKTLAVLPMTGNSLIPYDNTEPLITEGTQLLSLSISPSNLNSKMIVKGDLAIDCGSPNKRIVVALFRNTQCIAVNSITFVKPGDPQIFSFLFMDELLGNFFGSSVTYSLRIGAETSTLWYLNQYKTLYFNNLLNANGVMFMEHS